MNKIVDDIIGLYRQKFKLLLCLFAMSLLAYGYFIISWDISIDTELSTYGLGNSEYLLPLYIQFFRLGRPVLAALTYLGGSISVPYFSLLCTIVLLYLSSMVWLIILNRFKATNWSIFAFISLYTISPIYIYQFSFVNQSMIVGLGFFLSAISVYYLVQCISKHSLSDLLLATFLLTLTLGIYQSFILLFFEGAVFVLLIEYQFNHISIRRLLDKMLAVILIMFLSLLLYYLVCNLTYLIFGKSSYLSNVYEGWGQDSFVNVASALISYLANIFSYSINTSYLCAFVLTLFVMFRLRFISALLLVCLMLLPLAMPILLGAAMPFRILFCIPLSVAAVFYVFSCIGKRFRVVVLCIAVVLFFFNFKQISELTYAQNMAQIYNQKSIDKIYSDVYDVVGSDIYTTPIVFVVSDKADDSEYVRHVCAQSFYMSGEYDLFDAIFPDSMWQTSSINHRVYFFMKWYGDFYKLPTEDQINYAYDNSSQMPSFPKNGSIKLVNGIVIVKLSK